jgi:UDP-2,3-diacylglucosamine hydrolase
LFGIIPPAIGMGIAHRSSKSSRAATGLKEDEFLGEEKEWLIQYCRDVLAREPYDYFVFGHRHLPIDFNLGGGSRYINLGDWLRYNSYAVFDGRDMALLRYLD